jgi:hypothetical protein
VQPPEDGGVPEGHEIKGNVQSMLFHEPGSRYYRATKAEVWFDTAEAAEAAGFTKPGASKTSADADENGTAEDAEQETDVNKSAEGSASDEADAPRGGSEADDEGAV